jgi:hypothetical protein
LASLKEWWTEGVHKHVQSKKEMTLLAMLISWKIWKERNARVFWNEASSSNMIVSKNQRRGGYVETR